VYLEHFSLQRLPFRLTPDPHCVYWNAGHVRAIEQLKCAAEPDGRNVFLTGDFGVGKTLLLDVLFTQYARGATIVRINQPISEERELFEALHSQLLGAPPSGSARSAREELHAGLSRRGISGRRILVLVDDAHLLGKPAVTALIEADAARRAEASRFGFVLAGPLGRSPFFDAASECLPEGSERCALLPLQGPEVEGYIQHRLAGAGSRHRNMFAESSIALIFEHTRGIPRDVNALCDAALIAAHARKVQEVSPADVRRAVEVIQAQRARTQALAGGEPERLPESESKWSSAQMPVAVVRSLARVTITHSGVPVKAHELMPGRLRIGRAPDNDLQIMSIYVSRHHCDIVTHIEFSEIEETGSTNGLRVNGRPAKRHQLQHGDVVSIGSHEIRYTNLRSSQ
jgi:general secretion pathway protein A